MTTTAILDKLLNRENLDRKEAATLMQNIMSGELNQLQIAAVLTALRVKGETVDEVAGFVTTMQDNAIRISPKANGVIDTCGTGGDGRQTFNISTATAIVCAAIGIPVAKHGNRAVSSKCGSADVLEALDVNLDVEPESVASLIDEIGIGFLFAPAHHPAMKHVASVRHELGFRTVFNLVGPMANPAGVKRQLIGVYDPDLTDLVAKTLLALGSEKVMVVHGMDGLDEVSLSGETRVSYLEHGHVHNMTFVPEDAHLKRADVSELAGGTAEENANHILNLLGGKKGPRRDAVLLNAAFATIVADRAKYLPDGVRLAREAIDSGKAMGILDSLREASLELSNGSKP